MSDQCAHTELRAQRMEGPWFCDKCGERFETLDEWSRAFPDMDIILVTPNEDCPFDDDIIEEGETLKYDQIIMDN